MLGHFASSHTVARFSFFTLFCSLSRFSRVVPVGVEMRSQVAARPVGLLLSLQGTVHPLLMSATYQQLKDLPLPQLTDKHDALAVNLELLKLRCMN